MRYAFVFADAVFVILLLADYIFRLRYAPDAMPLPPPS